MAVAHDAQTRFPTTDTTGFDTTTGTRTFTHTPVGIPKGAIVVIASLSSYLVAPVSGVLYGGRRMTLSEDVTDKDEVGRVQIYVLTDLTGLTGPQTVTLQNATSASKWVTCSTVTAATTRTDVAGSGKVYTTVSTNPTVNIVTSRPSLLYGAVHGGASSPTSYAPGTGYTTQHSGDYGVLSARSQRSTSEVAAGTIVYNFVYATSDDWCIAAVAIGEYITPKVTSIARLSLASGQPPLSRVSHAIKVRARVTGGTGTLRAALYGNAYAPINGEFETNVSGWSQDAYVTTAFVRSIAWASRGVASVNISFNDTTAARNNGWRTPIGLDSLIPVVAGEQITVRAAINIITPANGACFAIYWYDAAGANIGGSITSPLYTIDQAGVSWNATPPANAVFASLMIGGQSNGPFEAYFDAVSVETTTGTTNITGDLESSALTGSFVEYSLPISDANAAKITNYSNLEIRFYGYSAAGAAITVEVDQIWLEVPPGAGGPITYYGISAMPIAVGIVVVASRKTFGQTATPLTFGAQVAGVRKMFGQTATPLTFGAQVAGVRKTFGQTATPLTVGIVVVASRKTFAQTATPLTVGTQVAGVRKTFGQTVTPLTVGTQVAGVRKTFGQLVFLITVSREISAQRKTFGQAVSPFIFGKEIVGQRKTFGQTLFPINVTIATAGYRPGLTLYGALTFPIIFSKDVSAQRKTFGQLLSLFIFGKAIAGYKSTFGQIVFPINATIVTAGYRPGLTQFGSLAFPVIFGKDVIGRRKMYGQFALPVTFGKETLGQRKTFGQIALPIIFTKEAVGQRNAFGQLSMQTVFGKETAGLRKTFAQIALPILFAKDVAAYRKTFGRVAFPIEFWSFVDDTKTIYGSVAFPVIFEKQITGSRKTFGQVTAPFILGSYTQGQRKTFGIINVPIDLLIDVESGTIGTYGQISLPIFVGFDTNGIMRPGATILNLAEMIYLGTTPVVAVYTENQQVWP